MKKLYHKYQTHQILFGILMKNIFLFYIIIILEFRSTQFFKVDLKFDNSLIKLRKFLNKEYY